MGRHTTNAKRRSAVQGMGINFGKALWISLAVVFVILAIGFTVQMWPKGAPVERPVQPQVSKPIAVDKKALVEAYNKGDFKAAIPGLEKYVSYNPNDREVRDLLASSYLLTGDTKKALKEYQTILKASPDDPEALYRVGVVLEHMGRMNEAITYLSQASQAAPNVVLFHSELARANAKAKFYAEAIQEWKIVLNLLPAGDTTRASVLAEIANDYIMENEFVLAKEAIKNGLKIDPSNEALKALESKTGGRIQTTPAPGLGVQSGGN